MQSNLQDFSYAALKAVVDFGEQAAAEMERRRLRSLDRAMAAVNLAQQASMGFLSPGSDRGYAKIDGVVVSLDEHPEYPLEPQGGNAADTDKRMRDRRDDLLRKAFS